MQVTHPFTKKSCKSRQSWPSQLSTIAQLHKHQSLMPKVDLGIFINYEWNYRITDDIMELRMKFQNQSLMP